MLSFVKMDFYKFRLAMALNTERAKELFKFLQTNSRPEVFTLPEKVGEHYCFHITFAHGLFRLSMSSPPDASYACFETALFDNENNFMNNEELGYEDVCRFDTMEEILEEILRLGESS